MLMAPEPRVSASHSDLLSRRKSWDNTPKAAYRDTSPKDTFHTTCSSPSSVTVWAWGPTLGECREKLGAITQALPSSSAQGEGSRIDEYIRAFRDMRLTLKGNKSIHMQQVRLSGQRSCAMSPQGARLSSSVYLFTHRALLPRVAKGDKQVQRARHGACGHRLRRRPPAWVLCRAGRLLTYDSTIGPNTFPSIPAASNSQPQRWPVT